VIGETVGNFEIISALGKGGMGAVYLAQQKSIKTKVAIKVLQGDISTNTTHVQRFFNEAVAVSQIHHSGIVKIFDVGFHSGGQAYLVMEYLQGETLTSRIKSRTRLGIGMVADFGRQIASVLDATHNAGITHRDLKPDNIYLVRDAELVNGERVKILDFGIAKLAVPAGPTGGPRMTSLNASSIGTPNYMSPEQWHSLAEADWRTDAYALGCVAFEMACGRPPFIGESMTDVCAQHLGEPPPVPSKLVPGLPPALDHLIARLLEKEPEARPSLREAMAIFTELAHSEGIALSTIPPRAGMISPFAAGGMEPPANPAALATGAQVSFETRTPPPGAQASFETRTPPPHAGSSQSLAAQSLTASRSQPAMPAPAEHPAPPAKKSRRLGLVVVIAAVAIAGTVGAAVVISKTSAKPEPAGSASGVSTPKPGGTPATPDAAIVAVAPADAPQVAVTPDVTEPVVDAAVEPADASLARAVLDELEAPLQLAALPARRSGMDPIVKRVVKLDVCFDATGKVTSVKPDSEDKAARTLVGKWRLEPHKQAGIAKPACAPLTLTPVAAKPPAGNRPDRDGPGSGSAPPPPGLLESLPKATIERELRRVGAVFLGCNRGNVGGDLEIEVKVAPDGAGKVVKIRNGPKDPTFDRCIKQAIRQIRFPPSQQGGTGSASFVFVKRGEPTGAGGYEGSGY
jgi:serine/threonine protein kinase